MLMLEAAREREMNAQGELELQRQLYDHKAAAERFSKTGPGPRLVAVMPAEGRLSLAAPPVHGYEVCVLESEMGNPKPPDKGKRNVLFKVVLASTPAAGFTSGLPRLGVGGLGPANAEKCVYHIHDAHGASVFGPHSSAPNTVHVPDVDGAAGGGDGGLGQGPPLRPPVAEIFLTIGAASVRRRSVSTSGPGKVTYDVVLSQELERDHAVPKMEVSVDRVRRSMRFLSRPERPKAAPRSRGAPQQPPQPQQQTVALLTAERAAREWHFQISEAVPPALVLACCIAVSKLESSVRQSEDEHHVRHRHHHHLAGAKAPHHPAWGQTFDAKQAQETPSDTDIGKDTPILAAADAPGSQARQAQLGDLVSLDSIKVPFMASVDGLFGLWPASSSG